MAARSGKLHAPVMNWLLILAAGLLIVAIRLFLVWRFRNAGTKD